MLDWVTNHPRSKVPSLRHTFFASPLCLLAEWSMSCLCSSILQVSLPAAGFHQEIGAPICLHYTNTAHNVLGPFSTSEWMRRHNFRERVQPDSAGAHSLPQHGSAVQWLWLPCKVYFKVETTFQGFSVTMTGNSDACRHLPSANVQADFIAHWHRLKTPQRQGWRKSRTGNSAANDQKLARMLGLEYKRWHCNIN